ncbi:hypothetical protein [Roseivivax sp. CAU 1761]
MRGILEKFLQESIVFSVVCLFVFGGRLWSAQLMPRRGGTTPA